MSTKRFPVLLTGSSPRFRKRGFLSNVPWGLVAAHEERAMINHGQTLERLAERGGLSCCELMGVLDHLGWHEVVARYPDEAAAAKALVDRVHEWLWSELVAASAEAAEVFSEDELERFAEEHRG